MRNVEPGLARALGWTYGHGGVNKFGMNQAVSAAGAVLVTPDATTPYPFPTAAEPLRVQAGGNAADTAAGAGAREVTVQGLDANWELATEAVATAGASASASTSTSFFRCFRAWVSSVGAYGAANTADITIENESTNDTLATIVAGWGQTTMCVYTVPAGKTGYMVGSVVTVEGGKGADVWIYKRENADDAVVPCSAKRLMHYYAGVVGQFEFNHSIMSSLPAKTDVWVEAQIVSGAAGPVSCEFDLILVDDR